MFHPQHKYTVDEYWRLHEDDVIDLESIGVSFTAREIYLKVYLELQEE